MNILNKSIKISSWANNHLWVSRITIVIGHIFLILLGTTIGHLLKQLGLNLNSFFIWIGILFVVLLFSIYPVRKKIFLYKGKQLYTRRKFLDFIIIFISFFLLIVSSNAVDGSGNHFYNFVVLDKLTASVSRPAIVKDTVSTVLVSPSKKSSIGSLKINKGKLRLKHFIKSNRSNALEATKGEKIIYTILALTGSVVLIIILSLFACDLACSGATAAAILVSILGIGGILFLFFLIMKNLYKKKE